jgi:hypothetical protein
MQANDEEYDKPNANAILGYLFFATNDVVLCFFFVSDSQEELGVNGSSIFKCI